MQDHCPADWDPIHWLVIERAALIIEGQRCGFAATCPGTRLASGEQRNLLEDE